ncbi:MAG: hypothetical protein IJH70_04270 [Oscillospiraceae bacterium]|nr:hypothetical protein [Oscillospiraceae bacterium]
MFSLNWLAEVTLNYTIGGVSKTLTASSIYNYGTYGEFSSRVVFPVSLTNNVHKSDWLYSLAADVSYSYEQTDTSHDYSNVRLERIEVRWWDTLAAGGGSQVGQKVIWDGDGHKIAGPIGPTPSGGKNLITYKWQDTDVDLTPPSGADLGDKIKVDFVFYFGGTVTDSDGSTFTLYENLARSYTERIEFSK